MLLRTRITLIVALGFGVLTLGLVGSGALREQLLERRLADTVIQGHAALWSEITEAETRRLDGVLARLAAEPALAQALERGDRAAAATALAALGPVPGVAGSDVDMLAVIGQDREPLFAAGPHAPAGLLDASALDRVLGGGRAGGLRQVAPGQMMVLAAQPLRAGGNAPALVAGRNAGQAVARFAARAGAEASLLTLRGDLAATTDSALWQQAALSLSPRLAFFGQSEVAGRVYSVTSLPVRDMADGAAGALVALDDVTDSLASSRWVGRIAVAGAVLLALFGLLLVNLSLWRSFRPLQAAIDALQALSRGDAGVRIDATGSDEIGRIGQAVQTFRQNTLELAAGRTLRERVRRRQETVIRRELQALADATDMTSREEVMALLDAPSPAGGAGREDEPLRRLARVMGDLRRRLVEQHQQLSTMVVELREALVTKTKLAGLQQELQIAAQVQLSILPRDLPDDSRLELHCDITPAREVGGDFYDYFRLDERHFGFVMADVSGKGVPAALFMAIARTLLKSSAMFVLSPASCMQRLNDLLSAENDQMLFVTVFYGVIDLQTGRVDYVNAGHNPPYLVTAAGEVSVLPRTGGIAVAVAEGFSYREGQLVLAPGDKLYLFTDGITEAFDIDSREYTDARLSAVLRDAPPGVAPAALSQRVLDDVRAFERGAPQADDMTTMVLRYVGAPPAP